MSSIRVLSSVTEFATRESAFDDLDAQVSLGRLMQMERRPGLVSQYLVYEDDSMVAVLPVFRSLARRWPHPWYDPRTFELRGREPRQSVIVGHPWSIRSVLRVPSSADDSVLRLLLHAVAERARGQDVLFPHYGSVDARRLHRLLPDSLWAATDTQSWFDNTASPGWEESLPTHRRRQRRKDRAAFEREGLRVEVQPWGKEAPEKLARWIAEHALRHETPDHPSLVTARYREWVACPDVEVMTFTVKHRERVVAAATGLRWQDRLTMYEVGLPGEAGPERVAGYIMAISDAPVKYAARHGIDRIYLGYTRPEVKRRRGALGDACSFGIWVPG